MSCMCQSCKKQYKVDLLIPDELWNKIGPKGEGRRRMDEAGLLCGICIMERIEQLDNYIALNVATV